MDPETNAFVQNGMVVFPIERIVDGAFSEKTLTVRMSGTSVDAQRMLAFAKQTCKNFKGYAMVRYGDIYMSFVDKVSFDLRQYITARDGVTLIVHERPERESTDKPKRSSRATRMGRANSAATRASWAARSPRTTCR